MIDGKKNSWLRASRPYHSISCRSFIGRKYRNPPCTTISTEYLHPVIVFTCIILILPILYYEVSSSGSFPCLFNSKVSRVVWLLKTSSRWNLKKRTMVTKITMFKMIDPVMTITVKIEPKFPFLNWPRRVGIQIKKIRALINVRRIV